MVAGVTRIATNVTICLKVLQLWLSVLFSRPQIFYNYDRKYVRIMAKGIFIFMTAGVTIMAASVTI